jgi:hypothetical protein
LPSSKVCYTAGLISIADGVIFSFLLGLPLSVGYSSYFLSGFSSDDRFIETIGLPGFITRLLSFEIYDFFFISFSPETLLLSLFEFILLFCFKTIVLDYAFYKVYFFITFEF